MGSSDSLRPSGAEWAWPEGPVVVGVPWEPDGHLVRVASGLAASLDAHLICAYVDPSSYLTEWEPAGLRSGASLDPAFNSESDFPSSLVRDGLQAILGPPGEEWSFRVLNGAVAPALDRLAVSADASLLVVGGQRPGRLAAMGRILEGSVGVELTYRQSRPVLVVPRQGP
ncbi:MAG: universal stress protein [Arthrobacter sp.]